jgi:hypothetical protein
MELRNKEHLKHALQGCFALKIKIIKFAVYKTHGVMFGWAASNLYNKSSPMYLSICDSPKTEKYIKSKNNMPPIMTFDLRLHGYNVFWTNDESVFNFISDLERKINDTIKSAINDIEINRKEKP